MSRLKQQERWEVEDGVCPLSRSGSASFHDLNSGSRQANDRNHLIRVTSLNSEGYCVVQRHDSFLFLNQPEGPLFNPLSKRNSAPGEIKQSNSIYSPKKDLSSNDEAPSPLKKRQDSATDVGSAKECSRFAHRCVLFCRRCKNLASYHNRLKNIREEVLTSRETVHSERQLLLQARIEISTTLKILLDGQSNAQSVLHGVKQHSQLESLYDRLEEQARDLAAQETYVRKLETRLGSREYHMGKREAELYDLDNSLGNEPSEEQQDLMRTCIVLDSDVESESLPSVVERYYDRTGDITIYRDRLDDLEDEHREATELRDNQIRQGKLVQPTELVFLTEYFNEREAIIEDYLQAKQDAERLQKECLAAGYTLEEEEGKASEREIDHSRRMKNDIGNFESEAQFEISRGRTMALDLLLLGQISRDERIRRWRRDLVFAEDGDKWTFEEVKQHNLEEGSWPLIKSIVPEEREYEVDGSRRASSDLDDLYSSNHEEHSRKDWAAERRLRAHYSDPVLRKFVLCEEENLLSSARGTQSVG